MGARTSPPAGDSPRPSQRRFPPEMDRSPKAGPDARAPFPSGDANGNRQAVHHPIGLRGESSPARQPQMRTQRSAHALVRLANGLAERSGHEADGNDRAP